MLEIEQKLIEIERGCGTIIKSHLVNGEYFQNIHGIRCGEITARKVFCKVCKATRKTLLQTTKECAENELEHLDYVIREINIDNITLENVIHTRIMNLKQTIDFINSQQIQNGSNKHDITTFDESKRVTIGKPTRPNDKTADNKIKKQEKA